MEPKKDDLFEYAQIQFNMDEQTVREVLKRNNHGTFKKELWGTYIRILGKEHLAAILKAREDKLAHLIPLENSLIIRVDADCWRWVGTPEALDAHWELEEMRRAERMRAWRLESYWRNMRKENQ